jgi:hypothetical protein
MRNTLYVICFVVVSVSIAGLGVFFKSTSKVEKQVIKHTIPVSILGGTVISVPKKGTLIVDGARYSKLESELGEQTQKLIREFIMETPVSNLEKKYVTSKRPVTSQLIREYSLLK